MLGGTHHERNDSLERAVALLRAGDVVAFPTETVYGLGADAENEAAVARIFELKGRPSSHPLIVHIAAISELPRWAGAIDDRALRLAEACWPGPLTLIVARGPRISHAVTGGLDTVGLRVPAHPLALELLRAFGGGIAAPSANRFGHVSPTTAEHVRAEFTDRLPWVLDGGPCQVGVESTIVDVSGGATAILRPGGVPRERIAEVLGFEVPVLSESTVRVPGQLASHYAPRAEVVLVPFAELGARVAELRERGLCVGALVPSDGSGAGAHHELALGREEELARGLYAALRELDGRGCEVIVTSEPEARGLGLAVQDRLQRAAGPRG